MQLNFYLCLYRPEDKKVVHFIIWTLYEKYASSSQHKFHWFIQIVLAAFCVNIIGVFMLTYKLAQYFIKNPNCQRYYFFHIFNYRSYM